MGADEIRWRFDGLIGWDEVFAPGLVENAVVAGGAESEDAFGSSRLPVTHARLLAATFHQRLAQTLRAPAADRQAEFPISRVLHSVAIAVKLRWRSFDGHSKCLI